MNLTGIFIVLALGAAVIGGLVVAHYEERPGVWYFVRDEDDITGKGRSSGSIVINGKSLVIECIDRKLLELSFSGDPLTEPLFVKGNKFPTVVQVDTATAKWTGASYSERSITFSINQAILDRLRQASRITLFGTQFPLDNGYLVVQAVGRACRLD